MLHQLQEPEFWVAVAFVILMAIFWKLGVHRTVAMSWHPADWGEDSPWMQLFYNARDWVG